MKKNYGKILQSTVLLSIISLSTLLMIGSSMCVVRAEEQPLFKFNMTCPTGWEREYGAMLMVKDSLAKNGIEMDITREDSSTFFTRIWGADTYRLTYAEGGEDAWSYYWYWRPEDLVYFSSFTPKGFPPAGWNEWSINNAVIDEALTAATSTYDMAERRQYYTKFTEEWQRDVPFIPLYYVEGCKAVRANIENYDILLQTSNAFDWKVEGKTPEDLVTVRIAIPFMENYINPLWGMASLFSTWMTLVPAFPQLLKEQHQPDGTYANVPDLAESYEVSKDGLTLTFHLHKNIAWTDGVPFTSEDVKVTFDGILDPNTGVAAMADLKDIRQVETPDKYTVVFRMSKLNPLILTAMNGFCTGAIVPAHVFSKIPHAEWRGYWTKVDQVVSLGAYKILELVPNERVVLEANPKYWRGKPFVSRIEIVVIPEISTAISALKKGEIDALGIEYPTSGPEFLAALPELEKDPSLDLTFSPISSTAYWGMNLNHPILGNRYVRLALANLIPIDNIIKDLLKGHGKPANGPIDATSPFYDSKFPPICQYNPEKAKEYLAKAGYTPRAVGLPSIAYAYTIAAFVVGLVVGVGAGFARKKRAA